MMRKIWDKMTISQRKQWMAWVAVDGVAISTAYAYIDGTRNPKHGYAVVMTGYVNSLTGKDYKVEKLFPNS